MIDSNKKLVLFISAGHREGAQGAVNKKHNLTENQEALKIISKFIEDESISNKYEIHTTTGSLSNKIKDVNELLPDLALDLHFNADFDHLDPQDLDDKRGHGAMFMYYPNASVYGDREGSSIRQEQANTMSRVYTKSLDIKLVRDLGGRAGWYWGSLDEKHNPIKKDAFLTKTRVPAFIPELGFIDNNAFASHLLEEGFHLKMAHALDDSIQAIADTLV